MGAKLYKPKTEKHTEQGFGNGLRFGLSSMQGWRNEMEDTHCAVVELPQLICNDWSFFAVFDGHSGTRVSTHCSQNLLDTITQTDSFRHTLSTSIGTIGTEQIETVKRSIRDGFLKLDEEMKHFPKVESEEDMSGSTAVCCLISPTHFFFANCGDSRAVLSRSGKAYFSTLDHKPINPIEEQRIQRAGGSVWNERVNGCLAVSRALGDYDFKQVEERGPCEQCVSPEPDITVQTRENTDEFLVLACDGIWDVMDNEELRDYVRHQLTIDTNLETVCSSILDTCLQKGSYDNMTIVIVCFPGAPVVSQEAQQLDKELNAILEKKVEEIVDKNKELTVPNVVRALTSEDIQRFPPGGGLHSKRTIIEETYKRLKSKQKWEKNRCE